LDANNVQRVGRKAVLRTIAAPFVVSSPGGARIRTRLRPTVAEAAVLRQVGRHLGRLYRADLAGRVRLGDVARKDTSRAARKRGLTARSTSRWAGAITRTAEDQYQLAVRGLRAAAASLASAVRVLDARIMAPVGGRDGRARGYRTQAERATKQRRRAVLADGTPSVEAGGRRLAKVRHNLDDAGLTPAQWRERWDAARMFLTADGEAGVPGGNYTINVRPEGVVSIALPAPLRHLANAPRGRYIFAEPVGFAHRGDEWADRVAGNLPVRYDISFDPERGRWYLDASWSIPAQTADLDSLTGRRLLGVDLNADHLAAHVTDRHGNPVGSPITVPLDLTGPTGQRDGRLRRAITALIGVAHANDCAAIAVENLGFVDARATGRETMGRGRRGKRFRQTVAGIPTTRFRDRLTGMAHAAGRPVIAVDPAYTSKWGGQHWRPALRAKTTTASRHHAAAVVIARRAHGHKARRRHGVTRTRPEDRAGKPTCQAVPEPVGGWEQPALSETARTTPVDKTRPALAGRRLPRPEDRSRGTRPRSGTAWPTTANTLRDGVAFCVGPPD
jgi:hypothetical protein